MIYTNNISEFSEKIERKLNDIFCDEVANFFKVECKKDSTKNNESFFYIKTTWCLSSRELRIIHALLDTDNLLFSAKENKLIIWSKIKEGH